MHTLPFTCQEIAGGQTGARRDMDMAPVTIDDSHKMYCKSSIRVVLRYEPGL